MSKAKESPQVQKTRAKLKQRLKIEHSQITSKALNDVCDAIRKVLARNHPKPKNLKQKEVTLFDENKHSAGTKSKYILKLHRLLKT